MSGLLPLLKLPDGTLFDLHVPGNRLRIDADFAEVPSDNGIYWRHLPTGLQQAIWTFRDGSWGTCVYRGGKELVMFNGIWSPQWAPEIQPWVDVEREEAERAFRAMKNGHAAMCTCFACRYKDWQ